MTPAVRLSQAPGSLTSSTLHVGGVADNGRNKLDEGSHRKPRPRCRVEYLVEQAQKKTDAEEVIRGTTQAA